MIVIDVAECAMQATPTQ